MSEAGAAVTILVAEDDPDDRVLMRDALVENRLADHLHFVEDGEELMDYLNRRGRYADHVSPLPRLILLDLNMPRKDGREVLQEIGADPDFRGIPVIVLTTSEAEEDIERSYELGANAYMTKPGSFGALVELTRVLGRHWLETAALPVTRHAN
jgi:CheY-like chemotaxis protein